ncbi:hypothetical protein [Peptoniphilus lacydonensis]|uniref:hypothetical protein n=2 Tax=Peptoniphilaceae TaxID=1570339 RepID=UPI0029063781|nr:hypothetical protein [Peptoniphilus lacydonensis]MDU5436722.1 hypothetical protein [Peptoniphilus lacydonensis]
MKNKITLKYLICICLIFLLMACSKKMNSIDNLDKVKIISTLKDFGYNVEDGELIYKEREDLDNGGIKIQSSKGAIFIFDNNSDVINVDALSTLKWDEDIAEDLEYPKKEYVKFIKDKYIPFDYTEEEIGYYTKEYKMYSFYKANAANIFNPYNQIRVVFDRNKNAIILYDSIDDFIIKEPPKIDEIKAKNIAKDFLSASNEKESESVQNISLKVIKSNNFFKDSSFLVDSKNNIKVQKSGVLHLAYVIEIEDVLIYVDAYNGKIIGGDSF